MKKLILLITILSLSLSVNSQYNQKLSINLSAGSFKTFGKRFTETTGPLQMPNYQIGFATSGGFQIMIGEHFSLSADFGIMMSNKWNYKTPDKDNYLSWSIEDTTTHQILGEGEDYLDLRNYFVSLKPKYYLSPGKKWNPYIFTGVNINWTRAWFENNLWAKMNELGLLPPDDTKPYNDNLEENFGIGLNPGFGMEFTPLNRLHFYLDAGYYFISLNKNNFKNSARVENFNAFMLQAGVRLNFLRSKDL
jgi:hypothetical protein